jgi:hypothetical protein
LVLLVLLVAMASLFENVSTDPLLQFFVQVGAVRQQQQQ